MRMRVLCLTILGVLLSVSLGASEAPTVAQTIALFEKPGRDYSTGPLWVWNDMLTKRQVRDTLRDLASQQVKQVWVHPRPGLMTPYLSPEWFELWRTALAEARRLDMNVWIYDENSYPSGFGGGFVPRAMPQSRGRGLVFSKADVVKDGKDQVAVYDVNAAYSNITQTVKQGLVFPEGKYLVAKRVWAKDKPWTANGPYVNLLSPGVTEKFLDLTLEPYRREVGSEFGRRIPGVFTDEPNIQPDHAGFPWSEILLKEFEARWGYDLLDHLPSLQERVGDWRRVRHNYFQVLHEQFVEHWAKPYSSYCASNHLEWTGHYWDHSWPQCLGVPDNMAMYAWHQRPSIDCLMNQYREDTHAQFGNVRMVRELSSVVNQLGQPRTLCEIYGAGGWDLRFEDMKRIGDWLEVLGVNTLNEHLSYVSIRGARKRDHPQSFSYHEPWWDAYHVNANYFTRLSAALSQGQQINKVLVLQPTTTAWMYQDDDSSLNQLGNAFFDLLMKLEAAQIGYDLADEDILANHGAPGASIGSTSGKATTLRVGRREYATLIIPPFTENLNSRTAELLGKTAIETIICGPKPRCVDGCPLPEAPDAALFAEQVRAQMPSFAGNVVTRLKEKQAGDAICIDRASDDRGILFHMRRELADGELLFLVNTSIEQPSSGVIRSKYTRVRRWDLETGKTAPFRCASRKEGISAKFDLPPSGSLLLCFEDRPMEEGQFLDEVVRAVPSQGDMRITRLEPNVLTLDYVDVVAGGESRSNIYFYPAGQFVWQKNGVERNPWDSAVQFKDELISRTFPAGSGFEATYRFEIRLDVPKQLEIVIERPDLYEITCNGKCVRAKHGKWWLDRCFGRVNIAGAARVGQNSITIKASPFTMLHELEPAYVIGNFSLEPAVKGFAIVPDRGLVLGDSVSAEMQHGSDPNGTMWLSGGVEFSSGKQDLAPWIVFDLGKVVDLSSIDIWNYNEVADRDLAFRGVKKLRISAGLQDGPGALDHQFGTFLLSRGTPEGKKQRIELVGPAHAGVRARFVRFDILSNHNGVGFPCSVADKGKDNALVGLAEVEFLSRSGKEETTVSSPCVLKVSGELPSHGRLARHLVDGSGLAQAREGWNAQGYPFYSAGVAYKQVFEVPAPLGGRFCVALPDWYGSVARVRVNGKQMGWITAPPFECDVTKGIRRGRNEVEVTVIGTLKNTLGPHHGNPAAGAAWPKGFQKGPENGPPPGALYSTFGYGLFKPMILKNLVPEPTRTAARAGGS